MAEVVWTQRAEAHLQEIYNRLEDRNDGAGDKFLEEVESALGLIQGFPHIGRIFHHPIRRRVIHDGIYGIFYVPENRGVVIIGVQDLRQRPSLIRRILGIN